jgi:ribose 5-phosphate isomerase A
VPTDLDTFKEAAAAAALDQVHSGMLLGLGTGSTAAIFVRLLGERLRRGELRDITAVCTSVSTEEQARSEQITLVDFTDAPTIDLAVDGADEIDDDLHLIKGRGGALLREKIVEQAAARFIVIADHSKKVERLGAGAFPVEVVRFFSGRLLRALTHEGIAAGLRVKEGEPFITDEGHHILDLRVPATVSIAELHERLKRRAGVVETGYFGHEATEAFLATPLGVTRLTKPHQTPSL